MYFSLFSLLVLTLFICCYFSSIWIRLTEHFPTSVFKDLGFPCGSASKESTCNAGNKSLIPGLGISPEEGKVYPLQYSGLENSADCIVHGVTKSWTWLSDFHFQRSNLSFVGHMNHVLFYFINLFSDFVILFLLVLWIYSLVSF